MVLCHRSGDSVNLCFEVQHFPQLLLLLRAGPEPFGAAPAVANPGSGHSPTRSPLSSGVADAPKGLESLLNEI